jgi:hypothetical protein
MNLSNMIAIRLGAATTGAGTTEVDGATIDMQGFEGVLFLAKFGTGAANNTLQAQQGKLADASDMADLAGSSVTVGSSDELVWLDVYRPTERYVRCQVEPGTSSTVDAVFALLYGPRTLPVDNATAGTIAGELLISPAEGSV